MKTPTATMENSTARDRRFGSEVSSPRFAAVSKPTKIKTPYSTPKRTPFQSPVVELLGSKAFAMSLPSPTLAIT